MSHELRTPLNSLLILAEQLSTNPEGNLTSKQMEFASTIRDSGVDLLKLISDILDLSKVESGTVTVDVGEVRSKRCSKLGTNLWTRSRKQRAHFQDRYRLEAASSDLHRRATTGSGLKNLLSNAFKFTERGYVRLRVAPAPTGWSANHPSLAAQKTFSRYRLAIVELEFQRTNRDNFWGVSNRRMKHQSPLWWDWARLAISRELARLLGGEIKLESSEGQGSTFTFVLPDSYPPRKKNGGEAAAADAAALAEREAERTCGCPIHKCVDSR